PGLTSWWNIAGWAMQWAGVRPTTNKLDHRLIFCGKQVRHFDTTLRESSTKYLEELLETFGATENCSIGNVDNFTILTHSLSNIVEPSLVRSVVVVCVITLPGE